ncbi:DNA-binding response regulator [Desulfomarina profundi]|uniref:DNA-binding response regulator n=1 Tax=Desulfomarina profundi TaxID=2772557 RepID=A0A8D5JS43_9BACT|nr:response regulator transcription factor [Desulfomarina profundi]BCL61701.1 DNA-binding response regulator [Desulfomarina profundi]
MRILIIDDEPELIHQIRQILLKQRYTVDMAYDGEEALERIFVDSYDLILLDIMLPKLDGYSVINEMRRENVKTPVLMLTAKGMTEDKIKGLDMGADDYLTKPFSMGELLARIRVLLRRGNDLASSVLQKDKIRINTASREVFLDDNPVSLTPKEFLILEFLLYNMNRAVSRFNIAEHVWGEEFDTYSMSNNIDVHIKNLRRKINDPGGQVIRTVRGVGYMIKDDSQ